MKFYKLLSRIIQINYSNSFITIKAVIAYIVSLYKGPYDFSVLDVKLYIQEATMKLPNLKVVKSNEKYQFLQISDKNFVWPLEFSNQDLPWLYAEVFSPWESNPSSYNHPQLVINQREWIIDAGSCEGFFSYFAFEKKAQKIIAVEPLPHLKDTLLKTFDHQNKNGFFHVVSGALSNSNGLEKLAFNHNHVSDSSIYESQTKNSITVESVTIDSICNSFSLKENGLIKMDIEGAEIKALEGAKYILSNFKPQLAIAVYHDYENALRCKKIILDSNPDYKVEFRGMYAYFYPPRPYLLFAY